MDELNNLPQRINEIYADCSPDEQDYLRRILVELSQTGTSELYHDLWLADYKEIPVDIDTFLCSDTYLGKSNRNGASVYPFWRKTLVEIFSAGSKYNEIAFTGATRIGKTSTAITGAAYMLYRLMCLRNPQEFYNKKDISQFCLLFFNITKDLARGVAFNEFVATLQVSPWFNANGHFSKSDEHPRYIPDGGRISIEYGSSGSHGLGKQIFCLAGDTLVLTDSGKVRIDNLVDFPDVNVAQYSFNSSEVKFVPAHVVKTGETSVVVDLVFENGSVIRGTPDHRFYTANRRFERMGDLKSGDYVFSMTDTIPLRLSKVKSSKVIKLRSPISVYDVVNAKPYHNFLVALGNRYVIAHNCAVMDEMAFAQAGIKDVKKAKERMQNTYNTVSARIKGTFRKDGVVQGKMFAVSSKNSDSDFMEEYIRTQLATSAREHMYVVDKPQWEILPPSTFHKETFYVAVGDKHLRGFIVPDNQTDEASLNDLRAQGFTFITPPIDMRPEFQADFDIALRDLAGISIPGSLSFITQEVLDGCINTDRRNPFFNDILEIGTKDSLSIEQFFHSEVVDVRHKHDPLFVHVDLSLNDDRTGISGVWKSGMKDIENDGGSRIAMPEFTHMFSVSIQAPRGDKIPYGKVLAFLKWIRKQGYNLHFVTRDQYQSEYLGELLEDAGFESPKISLDRTPDGYMALRSVLLEQRVDMLHCELLEHELIHLQRDSFSGKVDHVLGESKDVSDSFAGAIWKAIIENPSAPISGKQVVKTIQALNRKPGVSSKPSLPAMFPGINTMKKR